jgi:hypothetical protein
MENVTCSDDNSYASEDHGQQEGTKVNYDLTFEGSFPSSEPCSLTQGDLKDIVRNLNLSEKQVEPFGSRLNV